MTHLDEAPMEDDGEAAGQPKSNQDLWLERRATIISILAAHGADVRITDDMCSSTVTVNEEQGEE